MPKVSESHSLKKLAEWIIKESHDVFLRQLFKITALQNLRGNT